jgi:hypothetical protein
VGKEWAIRVGLMTTSIALALLLAEGVARIIHPINDGRDNVTLDGRRIGGWFKPGSVYRQVSNEYDALTTITEKGHRVPGSDGNPEVVFIGDSFTFGWGLTDDEAFATIYCRSRQRTCANLGAPGTGTTRQVERLTRFVNDWHWHPTEVKLFFFGMSTSFSAGNDFVDNYEYKRGPEPQSHTGAEATETTLARSPASGRAPGGIVERVISWQQPILRHSNLMRLAKYYWGPLMKSLVIAEPGQRMTEALQYTKAALQDLDDLSRRVGFEYNVYLLVPVQDIIRGSHQDTLATLQRVSPRPVISTAELFLESPKDFYYAFDGHLNAKGSRRIAEFLMSRESH